MKRFLTTALSLLLVHLMSFAQIGGFDPDNPGDPGEQVKKYWLTIKASPKQGGSFNIEHERIEVDKELKLTASPSSSYLFVAWVCNGDTLSKEKTFTFKMPARATELTGVFKFNPENPDEPSDNMQYDLNVRVVEGKGDFNITKDRIPDGTELELNAYPSSDYTFNHWIVDGENITTHPLKIVMPRHDVEVGACFDFTPNDPGEPEANFWNKETGEVIIDHFNTGSLSRALEEAVKDKLLVNMITVSGVMNDYDFGFADKYPKLKLIDISRVNGINKIADYGFDGTSISDIYLPYSIEYIGRNAFEGCASLESITCHATMPPKVGADAFLNTNTGIVVYVPGLSVESYRNAEGWKDFTIMPIKDDVHSITIDLSDYQGNSFEGMWLEIINKKNGQRIHNVITSSFRYVFTNIIRDTEWDVILRNEQGYVFARINNVKVASEDLTLKFDKLEIPRNVRLNVYLEKVPYEKEIDITWTDADGNYLKKGRVLTGIPAGTKLHYSVVLPENLKLYKNTAENVPYEVKDANNNSISLRLEKYTQRNLFGMVKDAKSGAPLPNASLTVTQDLGPYKNTVMGKSDRDGNFRIALYNAHGVLSAKTDGYEESVLVLNDIIDHGQANTNIQLNKINGVTVLMSFKQKLSTFPDVEEVVTNFFEYDDVDYKVFNKTKGTNVNKVIIEGKNLVLADNASEGDVFEINVSSKSNSFNPVTATTTNDVYKQTLVEFNIVELGAMYAKFGENTNKKVLAMLYDAGGRLYSSGEYDKSGNYKVELIPDGKYTLITMGVTNLYSDIATLSQLLATGISEGKDYVRSEVNIKQGVKTRVDVGAVPAFDDTNLYYTDLTKSSFTVNKPSVTTGNYITYTAIVDFKPQYVNKVQKVTLKVSDCTDHVFVQNSVLEGTTAASYHYDDKTASVSIPVNKFGERIRFCMIPTKAAEYDRNAMIEFELDGKKHVQPLGTAHYRVDNYTISLPATTGTLIYPVTGTAPKNAEVIIYDDDERAGSTKALASGVWNAKVSLNSEYNLQSHKIYAKIIDTEGTEYKTDATTITYNENLVEVLHVYMDVFNAWSKTNTVVDFNFKEGIAMPDCYSFYTNPQRIPFTVVLNKNDEDIIKGVTIYVATEKGNEYPLKCEFNSQRQTWHASKVFDPNDLPVNVTCKVNAGLELRIDDNMIDDSRKEIQEDVEQYLADLKMIQDFFAQYADGETIPEDKLAELEAALHLDHEEFVQQESEIPAEFDSWSDEEQEKFIISYIERIKSERENDVFLKNCANLGTLQNELSQTFDNGSEMTLGTCDGVTPEMLETQGYEKSMTTQGNVIYTKYDNGTAYYYDFVRNFSMIVKFDEATIKLLASNDDSTWYDTLMGYIEKLKICRETIDSCIAGLWKSLKTGVEAVQKVVQSYRLKVADIENILRTNGGKMSWATKLATKIELSIHRAGYATSQQALKFSSKYGTKLIKAIPVIEYVACLGGLISKLYKINSVWNEIPKTCEHDQAAADNLRTRCFVTGGAIFAIGAVELMAAFSADAEVVGGTISSIPTAGASLGVTAWGVIQKLAVVGAKLWFNSAQDDAIKDLRDRLEDLDCDGKDKKKKKDEDDDDKKNKKRRRYIKDVRPIHDPSGYVFEAVPSNRMEGVTATCYYKELVEDMYGDKHEEVMLWNAEEYAQKNPLFTDAEGKYAWDVPQGMWQVKFEKNGYETAYSEWLPVPPPQLDVNIGIKQNVQPNVKRVKAYEDAVVVTFDKYMQLNELNTENIVITEDGVPAAGNVVFLDKENTYRDTIAYATTVRFNAEQPFSGKQVMVNVGSKVKSYAGIRMQNTYSQMIPVEPEVKEIVIDSVLTVNNTKSTGFTVRAIPAKASAGKILTLSLSSENIVKADTTRIKLDAEGKGEFILTGINPGSSGILFKVEDTDASATRTVNVVKYEDPKVASPLADIAGGSVVVEGTEVTLTTETEGAKIYYTLDGSCPCDESEKSTRALYEKPIVINKDVTLKAYAVCEGYLDSRIRTYVYTVKYRTAEPQADIPSGTEVKANTKLTLTSSTPEAKIYYTDDGSDPLIENAQIFLYDAPIVIKDNVTIKAFAIAEGFAESKVAEFNYTVTGSAGIDGIELSNGISIYPVPVETILNVMAKGHIIEDVVVCDVSGVIVARTTSSAEGIAKVDLSNVPSGVYVVHVKCDGKRHKLSVTKR